MDPDPTPKALSKIVPWYEGSGNEKRLKIRGVRDMPDPVLPERAANAPDPGKVDEIHGQVKKALLEEDDRALGRLFEDVLDPLHDSESRSHAQTPEEKAERATIAFEGALAAELKEFCNQCRGWGAAYRLTDDKSRALVIRFTTPAPRAQYDVEFDEKMLLKWMKNRSWDGAKAGRDMAEFSIRTARGQSLISR